MYYVVCLLLIALGIFLITPGGARTVANMRHVRFRGQGHDSVERKARDNRLVGAFIVVGVTVVMLSYTF